MKTPFVLAFDVDQTLVDAVPGWLDWFNAHSLSHELTMDDILGVKGDLSPLMFEKGVKNPMHYWEQPDLYQRLEPLNHSQEVANRLCESIENIIERPVVPIVVSKCLPQHEDSKRQFISEHFPKFFQGFVSTSEKQFAGMDAIIDDSMSTVRQVAPTGRKVLVPTSHAIYDVSGYSYQLVQKLGVEGEVGTIWNLLHGDNRLLTRTAMWLAEGAK